MTKQQELENKSHPPVSVKQRQSRDEQKKKMENLEKNKAKHPHHRMFYDYYERLYYSQKVPIILNIHNFLDIPELSKLSKAQPDIPDQPKLQKKFHLFIAQQEISRFDGYPLEFFKRFWQVISPLFNIIVKGIKLSGLTPAHINTRLLLHYYQ